MPKYKLILFKKYHTSYVLAGLSSFGTLEMSRYCEMFHLPLHCDDKNNKRRKEKKKEDMCNKISSLHMCLKK